MKNIKREQELNKKSGAWTETLDEKRALKMDRGKSFQKRGNEYNPSLMMYAIKSVPGVRVKKINS